MDINHTAAPWSYRRNGHLQGPTGEMIGTVWAQADGSLCAAAPELLHAVHWALTQLVGNVKLEDMTIDDAECVRYMRKALEKAEQEPSK